MLFNLVTENDLQIFIKKLKVMRLFKIILSREQSKFEDIFKS